MHRRNYLQTLSATAATITTLGCTQLSKQNSPSQVTITISFAERLHQQTTPTERKKIYNALTTYIPYALNPHTNPETTINIIHRTTPIPLNGTTISKLLDSFQTNAQSTQATHAHLCLTPNFDSDSNPEGEAETTPYQSCTATSDDTKHAIITHAKPLQHLTSNSPKPTLTIQADHPITNYFAKIALITVLHELGHTLCLQHTHGTAWYGTNTPTKYNPTQTNNHIYISPMLALYYYTKGGLPNTKNAYNLPTFTGKESLHLCTKYATPPKLRTPN